MGVMKSPSGRSSDAGSAKPIDLGDVFVLRVKDLKMNTLHEKCLLHGELLQPWASSSREQPLFMNVIEDNGGDRMKLVVLLKGTKHIGLKDLNEWYPPKSRVCLKDPWFKVMSDGSVGIRVDDMNLFDTTVSYREVQESLEPTADCEERLEALRTMGNSLFKANDLDEALRKYEEAIQLIEATFSSRSKDNAEQATRLRHEKAHLIHSNRAMCFIKKDDFANALEEADRCLQLRPDFLKGYQRKVSALIGLGRGKEASKIMLESLPKEVPEISKAEKVQLAALLRAAEGPFSNDLDAILQLQDQRTWLYPEYFAANVDHCARVLLTVNFTAHQRSSLQMPDEELDEIIDEEMSEEVKNEQIDDLEKRKAYKKKIQESAKRQLGRVRSSATEFVKTVREVMEKDSVGNFDAEKRAVFQRLLGDVEKILDKGTREGTTTDGQP